MRFLLFITFHCLVGLTALAQLDHGRTRNIGKAVELTVLPVLDGDVKNDPAWRNLTPLSDFVQLTPENGKAATRKTEVFFGFSDQYLHVGVICYENDPKDIVVSSNGFESDSFAMVLDTFLNGQTGFAFGTNPIGEEYDGSVADEFSDWNWSTLWKVKTQYIDAGWSAEFEIPFASISYGNGDRQTWAVNFARVTQTNNEISYWSPVPTQFSMYRLSLAGHIEGIKVPPQRKNLKVTPYVTTGREETSWLDEATTHEDQDAGFDVKYSLTPSLTLDLTYNTDFAQVESDQLQVNLGRFSLFFPETRPFFLENAGIFNVWGSGVELFHSRRIGIGSGGVKLPISGGVKVTGKVGPNHNVGLLLMRADNDTLSSESDFFVARYQRELDNRSTVGVIATRRDEQDATRHTLGIDGQWGVGDQTEFNGFLAQTETPGEKDDEHAFALQARFNAPVWRYNFGYSEVGKGFNPAVGFVGRSNYRRVEGTLHHSWQMEDAMGLKEWNQYYFYDGYWDFDGNQESGVLHLETWFVWKNGADFWPAVEFIREGVKEDFFIAGELIPAGDYDTIEYSLNGATPSTKAVRANVNLFHGGFYNGDRFGANVFLSFQTDRRWRLFLAYQHNDIDLPNQPEAFTVDLGQVGATYAFTAKTQLSALFQHNAADDVVAMNVRFSWLRSANTGFFVGYNEFDDRGGSLGYFRKEILVKYTHLFDVL